VGGAERGRQGTGALSPQEKLTGVRPEYMIVARSKDVSTRRKLVVVSASTALPY
jgi:hypothetical protein